MAAESRATATWVGDLSSGHGSFSAGSGVFKDVAVTWASRTNRGAGGTSPEELIAAAHAACYSMAFSNTLAKNNTPPTQLDTTATCTLELGSGGAKITTMALEVRGTVPGLSQTQFEELAGQAEVGCPVSNALRNNVTVSVVARLQS